MDADMLGRLALSQQAAAGRAAARLMLLCHVLPVMTDHALYDVEMGSEPRPIDAIGLGRNAARIVDGALRALEERADWTREPPAAAPQRLD